MALYLLCRSKERCCSAPGATTRNVTSRALTLTLTTGTLLLRARSGYKGNLKIGYTPRYKWTKHHARLVGEVPVGAITGTSVAALLGTQAAIETGAVTLTLTLVFG